MADPIVNARLEVVRKHRDDLQTCLKYIEVYFRLCFIFLHYNKTTQP